MDAFWVIPIGIVAIIILACLIWYLMRQPESPTDPNVLLDKTAEAPPVDQATKNRDWSSRPCGSVMDWRSDKGK
jgi:hypothetical protein